MEKSSKKGHVNYITKKSTCTYCNCEKPGPIAKYCRSNQTKRENNVTTWNSLKILENIVALLLANAYKMMSRKQTKQIKNWDIKMVKYK
jgi:hypothetical protein